MRPVKRSRAKGVGVEAELGCLEGVEEGVNVDEGSAFDRPKRGCELRANRKISARLEFSNI
jgi:fructose/tagatose bisphosphate aldolase